MYSNGKLNICGLLLAQLNKISYSPHCITTMMKILIISKKKNQLEITEQAGLWTILQCTNNVFLLIN